VQLRLDPAIGSTTPDVIYRAPHHDEDEGIAIYLDGMSAHIHGNPVTAAKDREIRDWLRNHDWEVIEITVDQLSDADAMERHFRRLAAYLADRELRDAIRADRSWFERAAEGAGARGTGSLRLVRPTSDQRWSPQCRSCRCPQLRAPSARRNMSVMSTSGSGSNSRPRDGSGPACSSPKWLDDPWSR